MKKLLIGCALLGLLHTSASAQQTVLPGYNVTQPTGGTGWQPVDASHPLPVTGGSSTANIGNVGGKTVEICVTPTVTVTNAYGVNYVVGGFLTFANAFTTTSGSGLLQGVSVTINKVETSGFTFVPFKAATAATTWTDAAVANINTADRTLARGAVSLSAFSGLGTHTIASASGIGQATIQGTSNTSLFGVLLTNAALTNQFSTTSDLQICVQTLDDL